MFGQLTLGVLVCGLAPSPQDPSDSLTASALRVLDAPVVDGRLDEAVWQEAFLLSPLTEIEPDLGESSLPDTEVRVMRDEEYLYFGFLCFESEPEKMVRHNMARDAFLRNDDRIEIVLDTFLDRRNAYFFQLSAAGSRGDGLIGENGSRFNKQWDTLWKGAAHVGKDRWTAEIAIPFRSLSFGEGSRWGLNVSRFRGADRSRYRWAGLSRHVHLFTIASAGILRGLDNLPRSSSFELTPYAKARQAWFENPDSASTDLALGGEFNWRISPGLRASFTLNTDFAETEADQQRVNLTRFPLFFREKRDFFLEDSTVFEFGEQTGFRGGGGRLLPFFSRRIGLASDGTEIPLHAGVRLAGHTGPLDLGFLGVNTAAVPASGTPAGNLYVLRPSYRVNDELAVGALATHGNPDADAINTVFGLDLRYNRAEIFSGYRLKLNTFAVRSRDEASHRVGAGWGLQSTLYSDDWTWEVKSLGTEEAFVPGMGFVLRPGERLYFGRAHWSPRPAGESRVRKYNFELRPIWWTDSAGNPQSHAYDATLFGLEWHDGDSFEVVWAFDGDRLGTSFHRWHLLEAEYEWSSSRPWSGSVAAEAGGWYDGQGLQLGMELDWRPSASLKLGARWDEGHFQMPGGDFTSRVGSLSGDFSFSPNLAVNNLLQADNQSDTWGFQSRARWIQEDGRELFFVLNWGWQEIPGGIIVPLDREIAAKLVWSLRF